MSHKTSKTKTEEGEEVEELLRAAEEELLLDLSLNSHISRVSRSSIDPDLDRRFEALKSFSQSNPKLRDSPVANMGADQEDDHHLFARFTALKGSISGPAATTSADGDDDEEEEEKEEEAEDEVDKVIRWAMDAARLENKEQNGSDSKERSIH